MAGRDPANHASVSTALSSIAMDPRVKREGDESGIVWGTVMSEFKLNRRRKAEFLKQHLVCCFCGGNTPATTVDHVPSRQMFSLRRRPKGLEVPACECCNRATASHEQVAAMLGRIYPDGPTEVEREEMRRIMDAVNTNVPGLLEEMIASFRQQERFVRANITLPGVGGVLNVSGPLLNRSIQAFGAKLGFALHYAMTGAIVPRAGGVAVRWFSNFERLTGEIPADLFRILGQPQTLRQGKWGAGDQFSYAFAISENSEMAAYFSTFRKSFAVLSWVSEDVAAFASSANVKVHRPGQF